jgi:uncharacterized protein (DUF1919 family)
MMQIVNQSCMGLFLVNQQGAQAYLSPYIYIYIYVCVCVKYYDI